MSSVWKTHMILMHLNSFTFLWPRKDGFSWCMFCVHLKGTCALFLLRSVLPGPVSPTWLIGPFMSPGFLTILRLLILLVTKKGSLYSSPVIVNLLCSVCFETSVLAAYVLRSMSSRWICPCTIMKCSSVGIALILVLKATLTVSTPALSWFCMTHLSPLCCS